MKVRKIINEFKPDVMVGVGGYASAPAMYVASKKDIPILIQEQNSFAGVTNKLLANQADVFCVAYDGMQRVFPPEKIVKTGNPVRQDIVDFKSNKPESLAHFGLSPDRKTLLIIGGSLGARTINESIKLGIDDLIENNIQVIWQTGKIYFDEMKQSVPKSDKVKIFDFIKEMNMAYDAADVIISRAGALAISELCLIKKPVILVPSPNVAEDHQTKNAQALVQKGAAIMVKDKDARVMLVNKTIELLKKNELQNKLSQNIAKLGIPDAADLIAKEVLALIE